MNRTVTPKDNRPPLITAESLAADYAHLAVELVELIERDVPPVLEDDDDLTILTAAINSLRVYSDKVDRIREVEKRPVIEAGNVIQKFFKTDLQGRAAVRIGQLDRVGTAYLRKKAAAEVAKRVAAAEAAHLAAEDARRKAKESAAKLEQERSAHNTVDNIKTKAQADALEVAADIAAARAIVPTTVHTVTAAGSAGLQKEWTFEDLDANRIDLDALRPFFSLADIEKALRAFVKAGRRQIEGARIVEVSKGRWRA